MNKSVLNIIRKGMGESYLEKNDLYRYEVRDILRPMIKTSVAFAEDGNTERKRYLPEDQQEVTYIPGEENNVVIRIIKAAYNLFLKIIAFFRKVTGYFTKIKNMFTDKTHWLNIGINKLEAFYDKYLKDADFTGELGNNIIKVPIDLAQPYLTQLKTKVNDAIATAGAQNGYEYSRWDWEFELGPMEYAGRIDNILQSDTGLLDEVQLHKMRKVLSSDKLKGNGAININAVMSQIDAYTGNTDIPLNLLQKYISATIINARKMMNTIPAIENKVKDSMNHLNYMVGWAERVSEQLKHKLKDKDYRKKLDADIDEKFIYQGAVKLTPDELIRENMNVAKKIMESNTFHIDYTKSNSLVFKHLLKKEINVIIGLINVVLDVKNEYLK